MKILSCIMFYSSCGVNERHLEFKDFSFKSFCPPVTTACGWGGRHQLAARIIVGVVSAKKTIIIILVFIYANSVERFLLKFSRSRVFSAHSKSCIENERSTVRMHKCGCVRFNARLFIDAHRYIHILLCGWYFYFYGHILCVRFTGGSRVAFKYWFRKPSLVVYDRRRAEMMYGNGRKRIVGSDPAEKIDKYNILFAGHCGHLLYELKPGLLGYENCTQQSRCEPQNTIASVSVLFVVFVAY